MTRPLHRPREAAGSGGEEPFDYVETVISSPPGIAARALLNALMDAFFDLPPRRVRKARSTSAAPMARRTLRGSNRAHLPSRDRLSTKHQQMA
jgi:hypothetical protein